MPQLTEQDRERLEVIALRKLLNDFIGFRFRGGQETTPNEQYAVLKTKAIEELRKLSAQRKAKVIGKDDLIERQAFLIKGALGLALGKKLTPYIILERPGRRVWEAYIENYDEVIGVGTGMTPLQAMIALKGLTDSYRRSKTDDS